MYRKVLVAVILMLLMGCDNQKINERNIIYTYSSNPEAVKSFFIELQNRNENVKVIELLEFLQKMEEWSIIVEVTRVINTDDPRIGAIRKLAIDRWSTIEVKEANERQQEEQRLSAEIKSRTVVVTASTLYNDYEENSIRADSKYQGKIIELEGFVASVDKDMISNGILLLIKSPNQFMSIQVELYNSDIERAANLKRNQKVAVRCYEIKYRIVPMLSDCALI